MDEDPSSPAGSSSSYDRAQVRNEDVGMYVYVHACTFAYMCNYAITPTCIHACTCTVCE